MTEREAKEKLRAYHKCQILQVKGIYEDCNEKLCDNCDLCYAQGNAGEHIKSIEVAINALEKQIPKKPKHTLIKHGKHTWRKNKDGYVDDFAWDFSYHNGVVCEVCGETVCVNCNPKYDELTDCEEEYWDCPYCEKKIHYKSNYCDCGQKLDWSDE